MEGIFRLLAFTVIGSVVWLNWSPAWAKNFSKYSYAIALCVAGILYVPDWYGWLFLALGLADFWCTYQRLQRDEKARGPAAQVAAALPGLLLVLGQSLLAALVQLIRYVQPHLVRWKEGVFDIKPEYRLRVGCSTLVLTFVALLTALPVYFATEFARLMVAAATGDTRIFAYGWKAILNAAVGDGFIAWFVMVGLTLQFWFLGLPLLLATGFLVQRFFDAAAGRWWPTWRAVFAMALMCALPYGIALILDVYDAPYID